MNTITKMVSARRFWLLAALVTGVVVSRLLCVFDGPVIYDDSFITFRYAVNLADGAGFVYNPGESILGTTTPLWTIILGLFTALGTSLPSIAQVLGIIFDAVTCGFILNLSRNRLSIAALYSAIIWMVYPPAVYAAVGGMETSLFVCLNVVSLWTVHNKVYNSVLKAAAPLAVLTRPEGIIQYVIVLYDLIRSRKRSILIWSVVLGIPLMWAVYATIQFGSPIPHSIIAKRVNADNLTPQSEILRGLFSGWSIVLLPLFIIGSVRSVYRRSMMSFTIWTITYISLYLIATPKMWVWYYLPMQCGIVILSGQGAEYIEERTMDLIGQRLPKLIPAGRSIMFVAVSLLGLYYFMPQVFVVDGEESRRFKSVALRVREITEPGDSVLATDIGYLGFYSNRTVLDAWGLVWPEALKYPGSTAERVIGIAIDFEPKAVVVPHTRRFLVQIDTSSLFSADYTLDTAFVPGSIYDSITNPEYAPDEWNSHYLIFLRKK